VWIVSNVGYGATFAVGVASSLAGLACLLAARVRTPVARDGGQGLRSALGRSPLRRPLLVFLSSTVATGFLVTFLPLAAPASGFGSAASALLLWGATQTAARWWAGRFGDRFGASRLISPSLLLSAVGMLAASQAENAPLLLLGAALNGLGFGVLQNATIAVLMDRVTRREYGTVSALWNIGFDAGAGLGPLLLGPAVAIAGFAPTSFVAAGLMLAALLLARSDSGGTANHRTGV
jgi:MFS family permease